MYDGIGSLIEKYLKIVNSQRNRDNAALWENSSERYLIERWRGRPKKGGKTPFTMAMDIAGYSKTLNISCLDYYSLPLAQLHEQLRYAIFEFENLDCDRYFENTVFISFGSVAEASFFGAAINYLPDAAPWFDELRPVFGDKKKLSELAPFSFDRSGLMPRIHEYYRSYKDLTAGYGLEVVFPLPVRSPFSIALMLRGFNNLLLDFYDDPAFAHKLMRTITDALKAYHSARAEFLGESLAPCFLFNDEVSSPVLSPSMYKEFALPYEIELARHCGGACYWHSCGRTEDFYSLICTIPGLKMAHIGPWSDIDKAVQCFNGVSIEICLSSMRDMYEATPDEMEEKLRRIQSICKEHAQYTVRMDGICVISDIRESMQKMTEWCRAARNVFG